MEFMEQVRNFLQQLLNNLQSSNLNIDFNSGPGLVSAAAYVLMALGLYTIARNRGIHRPWLAWIPIGNLWLLGCISDHYRYVTQNQDCNRRKKLLTLGILEAAMAPIAVILFVLLFVGIGIAASSTNDAAVGLILFLIGVILLVFALIVAVIIVFILLQIQRFRAYYDLFGSCVPHRRKMYAAWSIVASCFGIDLVAAILIFLCRNKSDGMLPPAQP